MIGWLGQRHGAVLLVSAYCLMSMVVSVVIWSGVVQVRDLRFIRVIDIARQAEVLFREAGALTESLEAVARGEPQANYDRRRAWVVLRLNAVDASVRDLQVSGLIPADVGRRVDRVREALEAVPRAPSAGGFSRQDLERVAERLSQRSQYFGGDIQQQLHEAMASQTRTLNGYATWVGVLTLAVALSGLALLLLLITLQRKNEALQRLATEDPLTGLPNRRTALERGRALVNLANRTGRALSLVIIDLDHFKAINDRYGHPVGDSVIAQAGRAMATQIRGSDLLARVGGEEFMLILPDTDAEGAGAICRKLLAVLARTPIEITDDVIPVTASAGIASGTGGALDMDALYVEADRAMYAAKEAGRNRVTAQVATA